MRQKPFIIVLLTLLLCFSVVIATSAAQSTAKGLLIDKTSNYTLDIDKGFYSKSSSETNIVINKFEGKLIEELGDYTGSTIGLNVQLDEPKKTIKVGYDTKIKGNQHNGEMYLIDDKVILTKDIFDLIEDFDVNALKGSEFLKQSQYIYFITDQMKPIWEQMKSYQNQQLPEEYKDMLLFLIEAVPDKYVSQSSGQITIQFNQAGFEDYIYSLVTKVVNEKERFADIIYNLSKSSYQTQGLNPETMKKQLISTIENVPAPTMEQIHELSKFMTVNLTYVCSVLPNGPNKFDMTINIRPQDAPINGNIIILIESTGEKDNLKTSYFIKAEFNDGEGATYDGAITGDFNYVGTNGNSNFTMNVRGKNSTTNELFFDIGLSAKSTGKTDPNLVVKVPELNASNSLNVTQFIPSPGKMKPEQDGILNLFVNGKKIDCDMPNITEKGIMLPIRFVSEALGYQVEWFNPNEVRITGNDKAIFLFVGQTTYTVNGEEKQLDIAPYVEKDRTMLFMDFVTKELGASINLTGGNISITN